MTGFIDVGGGMRGAYGAAVLDRMIDENIYFDIYAGVSAGSANIASFLARQRGRNLRFYDEFAMRRDYMSFRNLLRDGSFLDLEYIYGAALTNAGGECPLDFKRMSESSAPFEIVATDALSGQAVYYDSSEMAQDDYGAIKGSSCVPVFNKPYVWRGKPLFDGGISDPIPFERLFSKGAERIVIVLTRPKEQRRDPGKDKWGAKWLSRKYPEAAKRLAARADTYNAQLDKALEYERQGRMLIVAPRDIGGMKTLTKDAESIRRLYSAGYEDAKAIREYLEK